MHKHENRHSVSYLLDRFLGHCLHFRNYSEGTIRSYRDAFKMLFRFTPIDSITDVNRELMEDFLYHGRTERKWSSVTYHSYFKRFNVFYKWCVQNGKMEENPLEGIEKPRLEKRLPKRLTEQESEFVLEAAYHMRYGYRFERFRNRAIVASMLFAGLRKSEVLNLQLRNVDFENRTIHIIQSKGKKDRVIPMCSRLHIILKDYVQERKRLKRESLQFFTGVQEYRLFGSKGINNLFAKLRKVTKLDFSAHTLRHSFATLMLEGGCDIYTLSQLMGHNKITTTTIYLQCTTKQKQKAIELHALN